MSNLPDIDTTTTGFIAFWNAIDQGGVSQINPETATSANGVQNYTTYDNGVEGDYQIASGRIVKFRVKNDGWIVVYMDRTEDYGQTQQSEGNIRGPWDVIDDWSYHPNSNTASDDGRALHRAINALQSNLDNSGSITFNMADVGLYNYAYPDATTMTVLSGGATRSDGAINNTNGATETFGFSYTATTDLDLLVSFGAALTEVYQTYWDSFKVDVEGTILADPPTNTNSGDTWEWGTIDLIASGIAPDANTTYNVTLTYQEGADRNGVGMGGIMGLFH